jgi:hypothetical protein
MHEDVEDPLAFGLDLIGDGGRGGEGAAQAAGESRRTGGSR